MSAIKELQQKYELDVFPKRDVVLVKGQGAHLWDEEGNEYIDCAAGIGVVSIGHANPKLAEALKKQADTLITCPGTFYNDIKAKALEKIISVAPEGLNKAYLCNSGTEAVETAIKFARYVTKKKGFISAMKGFHGRTLGALSATYKMEYREDFMPLIEGFTFVPYNNYEKLEEAITEDTAGIILEPIQGEGGINIGDKEYFQKVRKLCDDNNIMLIIDEIQTGFCRTGKFFATEYLGIKPDMMTVAKAMGGGFPVAATLCSDKIQIPPGKHGTTFGGNPLACSAVIASIDFMLENNLDEKASELGAYFLDKISKYELSKVREIRIKGLMIGIEIKEKVQPILEELMKRKIIALPAGNTVLRLLPPLVITKEDIDIVVENLVDVLK